MAGNKKQILKKGEKASGKITDAKLSKVKKTPAMKKGKKKADEKILVNSIPNDQKTQNKAQIKKNKVAMNKKKDACPPVKSSRKPASKKNKNKHAHFSLQSIKKLKPEAHSKLQVSTAALKSIQDLLNNICTTACQEAKNVLKISKNKTLKEKDIRAAFKTVLPQQLFTKGDNFASSKKVSPAKKSGRKTHEVDSH